MTKIKVNIKLKVPQLQSFGYHRGSGVSVELLIHGLGCKFPEIPHSGTSLIDRELENLRGLTCDC